MRKVTLFIIIFNFLITGTVVFTDTYQLYSSNEEDTLEKIAIHVYSTLPNSEAVPYENRYRGYLIYEENKDSPGLTVKFRGYDEYPVILISPGHTLKIPIREEGYPTVSELQAMIAKELISVRENIKKKNESISLQRISGLKTGDISKLTLSLDERGELILEDVVFENAPYVLTDGTVLPQSDPLERDLFVWKIIENRQARKTIFLFPEAYLNFEGANRKYLVMSNILQSNNGKKNIDILLESIDDNVDSEKIDTFKKLKQSNYYFDFFRILTPPSVASENTEIKRSTMKPSMALFYQHPSIDIKGLEEKQKIQSYIESGENAIKERTEREYRDYKNEIESHYQRYYELQVNLFLRQIEESIVSSSKTNIITDDQRIKQINDLQIEFVSLIMQDSLWFLRGEKQDTQIGDILKAIDNICGSSTVSIHYSFKKSISEKSDEEEKLMKELESLLQERKSILTKEHNSSLLRIRDEMVSAIFSALPEETAGICELDVARIQNQAALALKNEDYNVVIYYHPLLNDNRLHTPYPQNPDEHEKALESNPIPVDFFNDLFVPADFKNRYESDGNVKNQIVKTYILFKSAGLYYEDGSLGEAGSLGKRSIVINGTLVRDLGCILRVARIGDDNRLTIKYYFIPGKNVRERSKFIEEKIMKENLDDLERKILLKYATISEASLDL